MVKCADCGFLALRLSPNYERPTSFEETPQEIRDAGKVTQNEWYVGKPFCFMRVAEFRTEIDAIFSDQHRYLPFNEVIEKERNCDEFAEWQQGSSPKEHREMMDRKWIIKDG